jgi:ABC-type enterochelin transport system permease subunit
MKKWTNKDMVQIMIVGFVLGVLFESLVMIIHFKLQ